MLWVFLSSASLFFSPVLSHLPPESSLSPSEYQLLSTSWEPPSPNIQSRYPPWYSDPYISLHSGHLLWRIPWTSQIQRVRKKCFGLPLDLLLRHPLSWQPHHPSGHPTATWESCFSSLSPALPAPHPLNPLSLSPKPPHSQCPVPRIRPSSFLTKAADGCP